MATKRVEYFKHNTQLREDHKIRSLMFEFGPAGYAYFLMIAEMFGERSRDNNIAKVKVYKSSLFRELHIQEKKLDKFFDYLNKNLDLEITKLPDGYYEITWPNYFSF